MDEKEIYKKALEKWGSYPQMFMVIEEMAELTQALCKQYRHGLNAATEDNMIEEIVDVEIMLEQLDVILSGGISDYNEKKNNIREKKLARLQAMVEEE